MNEPTPTASSLERYVRVVRRQWWLIALVTGVALLCAIVYTQVKTPVYAASMKIVVGQGRSLFAADASGAFQPFTQTMTDLLQSDIVARRTIAERRLDITPKKLLDRLSATSNPDTSVLRVTYEDTDRERAVAVLDTIGNTFSRLVDDQLARDGTPSTTTQPGSEPVSATVFDPAHAVPGRVAPKVKRTLAIALVLGVLGGLLLAFLRDALSSRLRGEEDAGEAFGATVVGLLPPGTLGTTPAQALLLPGRLSARVRESSQLLAATLRFSGGQHEGGVIVVTSGLPGEGKTTVAAHLATVLARAGHSVVAAEADLHRPALRAFLEVKRSAPGLAEVLAGKATVSDSLVATGVPLSAVPPDPLANGARRVRTAASEPAAVGARGSAAPPPHRSAEREPSRAHPGDLRLLPSGSPTAESARLFSVGRSAELIAQLRERGDYVVIDTPPVLLSGDAFPLLQLADVVLVVCREGESTREEARAVRETLESIGVREFSVVLTEAAQADRRAYGYGYALSGSE